MKKFNLLVVSLWLAVFGISTVPTNGEFVDFHDELIYWVNDQFADLTWASPVKNGNELIPLVESEATQYFLRYTFSTIIFFLAALNIAFYAGNGTIRKWGGMVVTRWQFATKPIRERLALRQRQKQGIQLRGDPPLDDDSEFFESSRAKL